MTDPITLTDAAHHQPEHGVGSHHPVRPDQAPRQPPPVGDGMSAEQIVKCAECGTENWECHAMCSHGMGNCCEPCRATGGCTHFAITDRRPAMSDPIFDVLTRESDLHGWDEREDGLCACGASPESMHVHVMTSQAAAVRIYLSSDDMRERVAKAIRKHKLGIPTGGTAAGSTCRCVCGEDNYTNGLRETAVLKGHSHVASAVLAAIAEGDQP